MKPAGYVVIGVSKAAVEQRREEYERRERLRAEQRAAGRRQSRRIHPPEKLRMRRTRVFGPTVILDAAAEAMRLAHRSGWLDVRIEEIKS